MDADTRHQLKTNELSELIERLRDFNNPYVKYPLTAIAAILVGWIGWSSYSYFSHRGVELAWQKLAEIEKQLDPNTPGYAGAVQQLSDFAKNTSQPTIRAATRLHLARIRFDEAVKMPAEREAKLSEAKALLTEVRSSSQTPIAMDAAAAFALASTYESLAELGDRATRLDEARKLYEELTTQPRFVGSPFLAMAKERLTTIDLLKPAIALTPGDAPAPVLPPAPPGAANTGGQPQITVNDGANLQQLSAEEIQQLIGKLNPADLPAGAGTPPQDGQTPAPETPAPAEPAPKPESPAPPPAPEPATPPPADGQ